MRYDRDVRSGAFSRDVHPVPSDLAQKSLAEIVTPEDPMHNTAMNAGHHGSNFLIPCPYCKQMLTKKISINEGPQRISDKCEACNRSMIVYVCLYASGKAIVSAEACH